MPLGDWAGGTQLRPLRAITEFDPATGQVTSSVFECEVYAPAVSAGGSGAFITPKRFPWVPRTPEAAATVQQLASDGLVDIMTAEGFVPFAPPA